MLQTTYQTSTLHCRIHIILNISPYDILRSLDNTRALMQKRTLSLSMRENRNTTHDRLDWICIDDALLDAGYEECGLATNEVVVKVDEESEQ
jgi:hypothetical protein